MRKILFLTIFFLLPAAITYATWPGAICATEPRDLDSAEPQTELAKSILSRGEAESQKRWAVVDLSACYLRARPDYESGLESQNLMGTVLEVTGSERYWLKVNTPNYGGVWVNELAVARMTEDQKEAYMAEPKWICTSEYSHINKYPCEGSERISDFILADIIRQGGETSGDWISVLTASGREGWVRRSDVAPLDEWSQSRVASEGELLRVAKSFIGTPYLWGGATVKGFDCSGFVGMVYLLCGIVLPRNAREQVRCGEGVPYDFSQMRPGDLLFFGRKSSSGEILSVGHVAMYIGDGRIIHSSQLVRCNSLRPGAPDYYEREPIAVRRILGQVDCGKGVLSVAKRPFYFK